eukprot:COSAG01_NODE_6931_length_3435_cov_18.212530_4_plen_52_part_00
MTTSERTRESERDKRERKVDDGGQEHRVEESCASLVSVVCVCAQGVPRLIH